MLEGGLRLTGFGRPAGFWTSVAGADAVQTNRYFGLRFFPAALARAPEPIRLEDPKPPGVYRIFVVGGSAAMGFPEPAFSVARILEVLLEERFEGVDFEVVNAAMTAINSHMALPIVRDSARHEPDAFVLFLGNNEVVGPYGPGSVFGGGAANLTLLRWAIDLGGTRTGQAMRAALGGLFAAGAGPSTWRGMEMFLDRRVAADDPRLDRTYASFAANLEAMADAARAAGATTLLSTVPVNLRDCPPFAPGPGADYSEADSRAELERARDQDQLRFRADSGINGAIRNVAERLEPSGLLFVDAEEAFAAASPLGAPGDEWFLEHVHLRFEGAVQLAQLMADGLEPQLPATIRQSATGEPKPAAARIARELAYTPWDRQRIERQIDELMRRPPFTLQQGHAERSRRRRAELERLASSVQLDEALLQYEQALTKRPQDPSVTRRHAELLAAAGRPEQAVQEWDRLLASLPRRPEWLLARAAALRQAGRLDDAMADYEVALQEDDRDARAHFGLGATLQQKGDTDDAEARYERALALDPGYAEAHNNLGLMLLDAGDPAGAIERFQAAIDVEPAFAPAHSNRGLALIELSRFEEALAAFHEAVEADPSMAAAHFHLGSLLASRGEFTKAAPRFEQALRLDPDHAAAAAGAGAVWASRGELEKAQRFYEKAVELNPGLAEAQFSLAKVLEMRGAPEAAIVRYRVAIQAQPDYVEAMNNLAIALANQGDLAAGADLLQRAVAMRPDFEPARVNLEKIRAALSSQR